MFTETTKGGNISMEGVSKEQVKEFIKNMTLLDAAALVKELEEELGVSAAAPVAVAAAAGGAASARGGGGSGGASGRKDGVQRNSCRSRREEDSGYQSRARTHGTRFEGSQGP